MGHGQVTRWNIVTLFQTHTLPIRIRLAVSAIDIILSVKLPEKLLIHFYGLLYMWKTDVAPLLSREHVSSGHNILYLKRRILSETNAGDSLK